MHAESRKYPSARFPHLVLLGRSQAGHPSRLAAEKGIWASYIPYPGAMPIVVNSLRDDADSDPKEYRLCMEDKGYWHRTYNLPSVTNIYVYKPQRVLQDVPFNNNDY